MVSTPYACAMLIVTSNDIPGYKVEVVYGEVMGMTVRSANIGANFVASFRSIGGGEITEYTRLVYDSRQQVMERMWVEAQRRGANAVIGFRFDTGDIAQAFTEVCGYGTAVWVSPIPEGEPGATLQSKQQAAAQVAQQAQAQQGYSQPAQQQGFQQGYSQPDPGQSTSQGYGQETPSPRDYQPPQA